MGFMDWVHGGLDVAGMVPIVGNAADLANAGLYAIRGDTLNAGISLAGCIPGAGQAATGARLGAKVLKEGAEQVIKKGTKEVAEQAIKKGTKEVTEKAVKKEGAEAAAKGSAKNGATVTKGGGGGGGGGGGVNKGSSRGKNNLKPDPKAEGPHSTFKRNSEGKVSGHTEWKPQSNPRDPKPWEQVKRVDTQYANPHIHGDVPTPHTHQGGRIRPAHPSELPK
ncbi:MAG: hypothetical protein JW829_11110 [Pirellulales bacterium]|nr:hypothetical protein [Pirellulales bacterium]